DDALSRLTEESDPDPDQSEQQHSTEEARIEQHLRLNEQRLGTVLAALKSSGAKRVLDLGCGKGQLLRDLLKDKSFEEIVGVDVSYRALVIAQDRLRFDRRPP